MAFVQRNRLPDGQITQTVYGYIRDGIFGSAIELLQQQLQVCAAWRDLQLLVNVLPGSSQALIRDALKRIIGSSTAVPP